MTPNTKNNVNKILGIKNYTNFNFKNQKENKLQIFDKNKWVENVVVALVDGWVRY